MTIADTWTAFTGIWSLDLDTNVLIRATLGADDSITVIIQKYIERYLVAIPQWMSWNFLQQYAGLYQLCTLEANENAVNECWAYAYIVRTFYLVFMTDFLIADVVVFDLSYSSWKQGQEKDGKYQAKIDEIATTNEKENTTRTWPW